MATACATAIDASGSGNHTDHQAPALPVAPARSSKRDRAGAPAGRWLAAAPGGSAPQQTRQLQTAVACVGNSDTALDIACTGGSVALEDAANVLDLDEDSCCSCPPGTTDIYRDENLAFRFRPRSITTAEDGSLLWPAVEPPELAFTMTRYVEPPEFYDRGEAEEYYLAGNASEPSRELPADFLPGLLWEHGPDARYDQGA